MGIAEIGQRRNRVARGQPLGQGGDRGKSASRPDGGCERRHLVSELGHDAGGDLGAYAGGARDLPFILKRHGIGEVGRAERAEHRERDLGANALHRLQRPEPGALMLAGKAVEPDLVLAHMGVDGERHGLAHRRQAGERARADRHLVAHPADIDDHRVKRDGIERAGELADHGAALSAAARTSSRRHERE